MPGLSVTTVTIGSYEYECTLLEVGRGHPLRLELIRMCGEPLVAALAQVVRTGSLGDLDVEGVLHGVAGILRNLDPAFIWRMQETFVGSTRFRALGGQFVPLAPAWQLHFAGRYHELDQLTFAHVRANYLSFLADSAAWQALVSAGHQALSAAPSRPSSAPIGTSGASSVATGSA